MNQPFYKLMLVTNWQHSPLTDYLQFIAICAAAGITSVQLRHKQQPYEDLLMLGQQLKRILSPLRIPLIVNDHLELAIALDADGLHLGQTDGDPALARRRLGPNKLMGVSIDSEENLMHANTLLIDYVGIGALFATASKPNVTTLWGLDGLQQLAPKAKHPIIGIGGINEDNAAQVLSSGAHGIAVIGALHDAQNPRDTTQQLRRIIDHGGKPHVA